MWLSDRDILEYVKSHGIIEGFEEDSCEGATVNLTLDVEGQIYSSNEPIMMGKALESNNYKKIDLTEYTLEPGKTVTVQTKEYLKIPNNMAGLIIERHSIRLMGLSVSPASYLNPGYEGTMSLVIRNENPVAVKMVPGIKFCQLALFKLSSEALKPYSKQDQRYQGSKSIQTSKLHLDSEIQSFLHSKGLKNVSASHSKEFSNHLIEKIDRNVERYLEILRDGNNG